MIRPLLLAVLALPVPALADQSIRLIPAGFINWETTPEGVAFAALDGDRFEGAYMALVRLPAGTVSPLHVKSATMLGVMLDGQMTHAAQGATDDPPRVGPGGFYRIPAGLPHVSSCVSDTACVTVLYQDGAFDFLPVEN